MDGSPCVQKTAVGATRLEAGEPRRMEDRTGTNQWSESMNDPVRREKGEEESERERLVTIML